ncbi:VanZ family protein [Halorussus halophilus]|uniref:VanZ family protein n=1 Tax=Halorussus halophilus TaxID=2650975 RepID=UPI001301520F|nr:VanZ family protein [Halorussus halophilus]
MLPRWIRWSAVALVCGVVFYASVLASPTGGGPSVGPFGVFGLDKWLHGLAYAGLGAAVAYALQADKHLPRAVGIAFVVAVAYGVFIEFAQAPIPERHFSVADMLADAVGAALGVVVFAGLFVVLERLGWPVERT